MALHVSIKGTEYVLAREKPHLTFLIELEMSEHALFEGQPWRGHVARRYSEFRRLHKKLEQS